MSRFRAIILPLLLPMAVLAIYWQTVCFGLINIDDYEYLVRSKAVTSGLGAVGIKWAFMNVEHAIWMPLTWVSYMLDFSLFGPERWGVMHLHNVMLHAIGATLVYVFVKTLLDHEGVGTSANRALLALLAGAIWALHPLRTESVAWLASRKDVLSFAFVMAAFTCWTSVSIRRSVDVRFLCTYLLSVVFFALSALAKPSVMTFPLLQMCIDMFVVRRIRPWMYIVPGLIALVIAVEATAAQTAGGATVDSAPLMARLLNAMSAFGIYMANSVWPADLGPQCMNRYPALPRNLAAGVMLSFATGMWILCRGVSVWRGWGAMFNRFEEGGDGMLEYRGGVDWIFAGVAWFTIGLGPFLGIAGFGYHAFADRFTYIPAVGLSLAVAGILLKLRYAYHWIVAVLVALLAWKTYWQVAVWQDDKTVWNATLRADGDGNAVAHCGLGMSAFEIDHDLETACREFAKVRDLNESAYWNCVQVHIYALCECGRLEEALDALSWYRKASSRYVEASKKVETSIYGPHETSMRLSNHEEAKIAYALCDGKRRAWANSELARLIDSGSMSPSIAYLVFRSAELSGDAGLREYALRKLRSAGKRDYLQFRYLLKKGETR